MQSVKIKICGITNLTDAEAAVAMGVDVLGFNFYEGSPRYIGPQKAHQIVMRLPGFVQIAGVFVNATVEEIKKTASQVRLDWVQLHGDETPGFCASLDSLGRLIIKAVRIKGPADFEYARNFSVQGLLFDAYNQDKYGGTGQKFDWEELSKVISYFPYKVFLAGGINPDNVAQAAKIEPYAIDVCSGIESEPGKKDHRKMQILFENMRTLRF